MPGGAHVPVALTGQVGEVSGVQAPLLPLCRGCRSGIIHVLWQKQPAFTDFSRMKVGKHGPSQPTAAQGHAQTRSKQLSASGSFGGHYFWVLLGNCDRSKI